MTDNKMTELICDKDMCRILRERLEITKKEVLHHMNKGYDLVQLCKERAEEINNLKKKVDNLTETNYEYSRTIDRWGHAHGEMYDENEKLKKEVDTLTEVIYDHYREVERWGHIQSEQIEENRNLREELEEIRAKYIEKCRIE